MGALASLGRAALRHPRAGMVLAGVLAIPLLRLIALALQDGLGPNPAEALIRQTGDWTLRCLCLTLAVTPLRLSLGWPELARHRRTLGLATFAYACVHALAYAWLDMGLEVEDIARDVLKRPFIWVGVLTWGILMLLAATSWQGAMRRLGRRWQQLHRAVYAAAGLALLHFFWMRSGKRDYAEVAVYAAVLAALLGWRVWRKLRAANAPRPSSG